MRRDNSHDEQEAGQDSFLDIVANIVGILILLVMVVGLRTAQMSHEEVQEAKAQAPAVTAAEVSEAEEQAQAEFHRARELAGRLQESIGERVQADAERVDLAQYVAAAQNENDEKKQRLNENQRRDIELSRDIAAAQMQLAGLTREQVSLASYEPQVTAIESLPTPLAKTVRGDELHIRLAGGKAAVIPLDALIKEFKADAEDNVWRLESRSRAERTIGPIEGFRLRYSLVKFNFTARSGATGTSVQLERWNLLPGATADGEKVEDALLPGSQLMGKVRMRSPQATTITIWTYPDSFNEFRDLKRVLFEQGYATAGRPLPDGQLIGGSPNGSQSAAQ